MGLGERQLAKGCSTPGGRACRSCDASSFGVQLFPRQVAWRASFTEGAGALAAYAYGIAKPKHLGTHTPYALAVPGNGDGYLPGNSSCVWRNTVGCGGGSVGGCLRRLTGPPCTSRLTWWPLHGIHVILDELLLYLLFSKNRLLQLGSGRNKFDAARAYFNAGNDGGALRGRACAGGPLGRGNTQDDVAWRT